MRYTFLLLLLYVAFPLIAAGQSIPQHPTDPNATCIGSFPVTITIPGDTYGVDNDDDIEIEDIIFIMRTSTGQNDLMIDLTQMSVTGDADEIDSMDATEITDLLSRAGLVRSVALGFTSCKAEGVPARVWSNSCVTRSGSGSSTSFNNCNGTSYCSTDYMVTCQTDGTTTVVSLAPDGMPCTAEQ